MQAEKIEMSVRSMAAFIFAEFYDVSASDTRSNEFYEKKESKNAKNKLQCCTNPV